MSDQGMRVISLRAENFKRLVAVEITPDSDVVVISGANGQGKSSVLDSIWAALAGRAGQVDVPVRVGEDHALVELDLGTIRVSKRWTPDGKATLEVTSEEGAKYGSPQKMLDSLLGRFSFDPLAFATAKASEQRDVLLGLSGLGPTLEQLEAERRRVYEERTDVNREVKRAEGALSQMPRPPADTPDDEVDVTALANQYARVTQHVIGYNRAVKDYQDIQAQIARLNIEAGQAAEAGRMALAALAEEGASDTVAAQELAGSLLVQMDNAKPVNQAVRAKKTRAVLLEEIGGSKNDSALLTEELTAIEKRKADAILAADLPVPGLGFDEDGITLNGVAFSQASAAERLRTSVAIAMAANPQVRIIRITDGSLLDGSNMALIAEMAADQGYQIWVERVDDSGQVGIVIEEGQVVS